MINKIIAEYLRTNKRLVVPHFGAFIRKENSEAIVFVPFLEKGRRRAPTTARFRIRYGLGRRTGGHRRIYRRDQGKHSRAGRVRYRRRRQADDRLQRNMLFGTRRRAGASSGRPARRYGIPGRPGLVPGTIGRAGTAYEDSAAGASDGKNRQTRRSSLPAIARPQAGGAISARYPPEQPGHFPVGARRSLRQSPSCPHASSGRPARTDFPNTHAECPPRKPTAPAAYAAPRTARRHGIPSVAPGGRSKPPSPKPTDSSS